MEIIRIQNNYLNIGDSHLRFDKGFRKVIQNHHFNYFVIVEKGKRS